jgi:aspartyl protease family protein
VNGDDAPRALYLLLLLMLVGSSLIGMRLPVAKAAKMLLAWVAIFGVAFILFAFRDEFSSVGERLRAEATGAPIARGDELRIPISEDGHYWVEASINGHRARFLVDSGATMTTIDNATATNAGLAVGRANEVVRTGNGLIRVANTRVQTLEVGTIELRNMAMHVTSTDGLNVLGMNFLSSLRRWGVEGRWLVLVP